MSPFDPEAREREAREEITATRIPAPIAAGVVAGFLLLLAAGPALELRALAAGRSRLVAPLPSAPGALATARAAIAELETRWDERTELVRAVRPTAQGLLLRVLRYGNEKAYAGRDGWLFLREGFDHLTARPAEDAAQRAARVAIGFRGQLAGRGIELVVVPAPVKLALEPRRFAPRAPSPPLRPEAEAEFFAALSAAGIAVFDPAAEIARRAGPADAYLERDTHWRPETLDAVARELAIRLRGLVDLPTGDPARWRETELELEGEGDLTRLLGLPDAAAPPRQRVEVRRVERADGAPWRPERGAPVLLLGDSFTAVFSQTDLGWGSGAGLAERLSFRLGLPVDRIVRNAGGASATREALASALASDPARLDGVRVVVWELATREITQGSWRELPLPPPPASVGSEPAEPRGYNRTRFDP